MSLLGPYKFIKVNLFFSTAGSQIMWFPSGSDMCSNILSTTFCLNKIVKPLEFDVPELKKQSFSH